ncbi:hypothetical protein pEaSNUABM12_00034 [Erwinia phage pEa_SNUABM_12]|uniref:Uncharacterized protein n=1 Tax=Erwinia phage pEa_SNUABM_12 TaxID=2768773 RepID=A0A7L8ZLC5_9CAUD|nr:hypothetical protein pEaSNUABM12_00034 [Erwinia phage pEa_SNUABM_12]
MISIQSTLNDLIAHRERLLNESIKHASTIGYVYIRPFNLGLLVEQLPEGVQVGPAMGDELPTIFSERMVNANLSLVKSIAKEPEVKFVSIQKYISDSLESTENTIKMIQSLQPEI